MSQRLSEQQRVALRRLRGLHHTNMLERYPSGRWDEREAMAVAMAKWFADCRVAIDLALRSHHHDDDQHITAAWLESSGFVLSGPDWLIEDDSGNVVVAVADFNDDELPTSVDVCDGIGWPFDIYTRGQVRGLCEQAGVLLVVDDSD